MPTSCGHAERPALSEWFTKPIWTIAEVDPGTGVFGTPAPDWNAVRLGGNAPQANTWQTRGGGGGYVRRREIGTSGAGYFMALIPWLTRKSTASVTFTQVDNAGTDVTATFTQSDGSGAKTLTCDPSSAQNGAYSGMFSAYGSDNTRFVTTLFSYS